MADYMNFPKRWEDFLHDYEFEDSRRIYTNGSRLIPSFRVKQMMEHYFPADVEPVRHGHWIVKQTALGKIYSICSNCEYDFVVENDGHFSYLDLTGMPRCPNCGARMHEEVTK